MASVDEELQATRDMVLSAAKELHNDNMIVSRETLRDRTGFPMHIVDDRVRFLIDRGLMIRCQRGIYQPVEVMPPTRQVYHSVLPGGLHKLEVGDDVLTLTPEEARTVGFMFSGAAFSYQTNSFATQYNETARQLSDQVAQLSKKLYDQSRRHSHLAKTVYGNQPKGQQAEMDGL